MQNKNINFKWIEDLNVKNNTRKICVKYFGGGQRESCARASGGRQRNRERKNFKQSPCPACSRRLGLIS